MSNPVAKYKNLNLFDGKLIIPIKMWKCEEPSREIATHYGYEGKRLKQIYVKPKDQIQQIASPDDIDKIVPISKVDKVIEDAGVIKSITDFPGLVELIEENKEKKNDPNITVLGIFDKSGIPYDRFSGDQYYVYTGTKGEKMTNPQNMQIFQYLKSYLENNNKYIHIKYYWNCPTTQKIGVLYVKNNGILISGLLSDMEYRSIPKFSEIKEEESIKELFSEKMNKFYQTLDQTPGQTPCQPTDPKLWKLEWFEEYLLNFESKGVGKKKTTPIAEITKTNNQSLIDALSSI